jgi:hypothetical protein
MEHEYSGGPLAGLFEAGISIGKNLIDLFVTFPVSGTPYFVLIARCNPSRSPCPRLLFPDTSPSASPQLPSSTGCSVERRGSECLGL